MYADKFRLRLDWGGELSRRRPFDASWMQTLGDALLAMPEDCPATGQLARLPKSRISIGNGLTVVTSAQDLSHNYRLTGMFVRTECNVRVVRGSSTYGVPI